MELKHKQRVSFDAVVKAVDIGKDSQELNNSDPSVESPITPVIEESSSNPITPDSEKAPHEYTVPLNDTQPKEGPTIVERIRAVQFHGALPTNEQWSSTNNSSISEGMTI